MNLSLDVSEVDESGAAGGGGGVDGCESSNNRAPGLS